MKYLLYLLITSILIPLTGCASIKRSKGLNEIDSFKQELEIIRKEYNLPALAAVFVNNEGIIQVGATGLRAIESNEKATIHDKFHFGSNTKSMTATLMAKMIDDGLFKWNDTIEMAFPGLYIHKDYKNVTLEQLLRHQGGTTANLIQSHPEMWRKFWEMQQSQNSTSRAQRNLLASTILKEKPNFKPGIKSNYSNTGITLVAIAIENKLNDKFENIIKESLFNKLDMKSCGFGAAGTSNTLDQPRGHILQDGKIVSINPGPFADNPDAIAPAGKVHCSIVDWGRYIKEHLRGAQGMPGFITLSSFKKLHSPLQNQIFGLGWINLKPIWAKEDNHIFHNGSNTMNYAEMWISPKKNYAISVVTNIGNQKARKAVRKAVEMIAKRFVKEE